ncbi:MAG: ATP-binding protein [Endomicrobiales bacterium]|jgi:signal transduction histidine kinase
MEDSWDWVQEELKKIQDDIPASDEMVQVVDAISVADFWKRRYDDERLLWERKLEVREGEKQELRQRAEEHASSLQQLDWKLKELERRWEQEKLFLQDRVKTKEMEATLEKTKFEWEKRIEALEEENKHLKVQMGFADGTMIPGPGMMSSPLLERSLREKEEQFKRAEEESRVRLEKLETEKNAVAQTLAEKEKQFISEKDKWQKLEKEVTQLSTQMSSQLLTLKAREEEHFVILEDLARGFAHRVRNYLGIMSGTIQLSLANFTMEPELADQLKVVDQNVQDMLISIEDFLMLARIPEMNLQPQDINQLLATTVQLSAGKCASQRIIIKKNPGTSLPYYLCDQKLFADAIHHLIENAVDAMAQGGTLTVSTSYDAALKVLCITIADTGSGINESHIKKVFQPYFTSKKNHKGLGLTIAKRVIDLHRGTLVLSSVKAKGTTVTISLFLES